MDSESDFIPAWTPTAAARQKTHLYQFMSELNMDDVKAFHRWTVGEYAAFWEKIAKKLNIVFKQPATRCCDLTLGWEHPRWFPDARINIVDSCFTAPSHHTALIYLDDQKNIHTCSYGELETLTNRIANSLVVQGMIAGDAIAIIMPMDKYAVAIYLAIIKMGGVVVSIAESFSSQEIATRLNIANAKLIFTQDEIKRGEKIFSLYEKIRAAPPAKIIVLSRHTSISTRLQAGDLIWQDFLVSNTTFFSVACDPMSSCHILFSSGTTATPKAIPWNHTTPIKVASDAYLHHDLHAGERFVWPTNLGWMMGPWLLFATLINHATIALYTDVPKDRMFGEFIQNAQINLLGVVPTLVATWRQTQCMENLNWQHIKLFTSTGECSNPDDMLYLMSLAGNKPVIEYCGGTEIGGAYVTSTLIENNYPSLCSTPAMGSDFIILDEAGKPANHGEVAIIPPAIGLSVELLNANHHQVYFAGMPTINDKPMRRHGDYIKQISNGYYSLQGRIDDTMNLGGIKISAAEIERAFIGIPYIIETAAIAVSTQTQQQGPQQLVIYAATSMTTTLEKKAVMRDMQQRINTQLNPLFKIHDVILVIALPKTASNKIMRRVLRDQYIL